MGDDLAMTMATTTSPLTGAQFGDIPLNKVVTGGSFQFTIPFKEINLDNISLAFGNSIRYGTAPAGGVLFAPRVGKDLRALARPLRIVKLTGVAGDESTEPEDTFIFYLVSPTDAEVTLTFAPTEQRVLSGTFEAWPDSTKENNPWGYVGEAPTVEILRALRAGFASVEDYEAAQQVSQRQRRAA
jgi:hypothetical protein